MSIVHVIAIITTKPGQREAVLEKFLANIPAVLAEEGCIAYEATTDDENAGSDKATFGPDTFVVVEKWSSIDTLNAHGVAPHMKAYGASVSDMIADRAVHVLSAV